MAFSVLIAFSKYMAPDIIRMVPEDHWSGYSGSALRVSRIVAATWIYVSVLVVAGISALIWSLPRWTGDTRDFVDKLPFFAIYRSYNSAAFMIALSSLLNSGIPIDSALARIKTNVSPWMASHINRMLSRMINGVSYGIALDTGLLDDRIADKIKILAKSKNLSKSMKNIGEDALIDGLQSIERKTAVASVIGMVLAGSIIGWLVLAQIDLQSKLGQQSTNVVQTAPR